MNKSSQPNLIWICVDQMRAQAMSSAGDPNVNTPNLDRLSAEGITFSNAVSGTPLCTPFRGALLTGRYPHQTGVLGLDSPLPTDCKTVADAFKDHGYQTCWIGKWHLDGDRPELDLNETNNQGRYRVIPQDRRGGFEDWWAYENNNRPFDCIIHTDYNMEENESYRLPGYETDDLTDIMIRWLGDQAQIQKKGDGKPFFTCLSIQPPHNPYVAPDECMARHNPSQLEMRPNVPSVKRIESQARRELAGYYAAIERIDQNVGRIRHALDQLGLSENTHIIFFSDHGDLHGSHGQFRKTQPWEESIRIPFIVGGPSREHQNLSMTDVLINHVDIAPTSLGICGITPPEDMVGTDYSKLIEDPTYEGDFPQSAYLSLPKSTGNSDSIDRPWRGIVTLDGWKYAVLEGQPWLMFDLKEDPFEMANLAFNPKFSAQRKLLHTELRNWMISTGDEFVLPTIQ